MTATTLRKSFFNTRFWSKVAENKKLLIVNSALELIGLPMICVTLIIDAITEGKRTADYYPETSIDDFMGIWVAALFISIAMGALIALFNFSYLYKKSLVDMNLSLPLSTKQRFFADYLAGAFVYFAPVIAAILLSYIILGIGNAFVDFDVLEMSLGFGQFVLSMTKIGITVLIAMLLYYTISVFSIVFCGSTFEAVSSIFLVNAFIPATIASIWTLIIDNSDRLSGLGLQSSEITYNPVLTSTSPIGCGIYIVQNCENIFYSYSGQNEYTSASNFKWIVVTLLFTALLIFASLLIYRMRKAEDVSKPYIFKGYYYALMSMVVFSIMSVLSYSSDDIFVGIFICAIGWFIMEVITRRGFRRMWVGCISFVGSIAIFFGFTALCSETDNFGISKYVPSTMNVESATINIRGGLITTYHIHEDLNFRDKEVINDLTEFQKEIIDRNFNPQNYSYKTFPENYSGDTGYADSSNISITYFTRTGACIKRSYNFPSHMAGKLMKDILLSDEFADKAAETLAYTSYSNYNDEHDHSNYHASADLYERDKAKASVLVYDRVMGCVDTITLSCEEMTELKKAYAADLKAMTKEQLEAKKEVAYLNGSTLFVLDSFENTLSYLSNKGADIPEIDKNYIEENSGIDFFVSDAAYFSYMFDYYETDDISQFDGLYSVENITSVDHHNNEESSPYASALYTFRYCDNDVICRILENSTFLMFDEKPAAEVQIGEKIFYLPDSEENRKLAKEVEKMFKGITEKGTTTATAVTKNKYDK